MKIATSELEHLREEVKNCHRIIKDLQKKREFVGLTEDEVTICHSLAVLNKKHDSTDPSFTTLLHQQIEAKLKEKNNG